MKNLINRIAEWVKSFWTRKPAQKKVTRQMRQKEHYGAHYYLGDLLEQLESCADDFKLFKKSDPDSFEIYSRIGASVVNSDYIYVAGDLEAHITENGIPSFAAKFFGADPKNDDLDELFVKFAYVVKQKRFVNVQLSNKEVYKVGIIYKDPLRPQPYYDELFMGVGRDGSVEPLKVCHPKKFRVGRHGNSICRMEWDYPAFLDILSRVEKNGFEPGDIRAVAKFVMVSILHGYSAIESGFMVRAKKDKAVSVFAIDMLRSPYFFADRIKIKNENGRTKHIFHYVKGYKKMNGTFIKPHFRGLRKFHWNGFDVSVSMPGKQHMALSDATFSGIDEIDMQPGKKYLNTTDLGRKMAERLEA